MAPSHTEHSGPLRLALQDRLSSTATQRGERRPPCFYRLTVCGCSATVLIKRPGKCSFPLRCCQKHRAFDAQVTIFRVTGAEGGEQQDYLVLTHCRRLLRNIAIYQHPFNEQVTIWKSAADHLQCNVKTDVF